MDNIDKKEKMPPKKSIRNISLPKKDKASEPARKTKHLEIEKEDEAYSAPLMPVSVIAAEAEDLGPAIEAPAVSYQRGRNPATPAPGRQDWHEHVEEAFLSSDDVAEEKRVRKSPAPRAPKPVRDADDFGNTSSESHFQPLKAEKKRKHRAEVSENEGYGGNRSRAGRTLVISVVALLAIFGLMHTVFAKASVALPSAKIDLSLSEESLPNGIMSSVISNNSEKKVSIESVKSVSVNRKATGTVILYNNYSTDPYELVKTTRLSTANGSIYRLVEDIKIPGKKTVGGKSVPGTINAKVEADAAGSEYNAKGGLSLNLPGLIAGTAKYTQIYAKTAANFSGGSKGTAPDFSASGLDAAIKSAKDEAADQAIAEARAQHPELVFLDDSLNVVSSYDSSKIPAAPAGGGSIEIPVRFTAKVIGLDREELKKELGAYLAAKSGQPLTIDSSVLDFLRYEVSKTADDALASGRYSIKVSGGVSGSFGPDLQAALQKELAGKSTAEARIIVDARFPDKKVVIKAWPFWKSTLPADPEKIRIIVPAQ